MSQNLFEPSTDSQIYFHTPSPVVRETFLYPLCMGHFWCDKKYHVARNSYDSYLLIFIKSGNAYVKYGNTRESLSPGQVMLLNCYEPHAYGAVEYLEFYWIHFDGPQAPGYVNYLHSYRKLPVTLGPKESAQMEELFRLLLPDGSGITLTELQHNKYITDMLTLLSVSGQEEFASSPSTAIQDSSAFSCRKAVGYMQQNFQKDITLNEIAGHVSLSPYYFIRCFKRHYGMTPHHYLMNLRLDSARFYLRSTAKTVSEIAFLCGFQSENNFCIAFKKQAGMTPTRYRAFISSDSLSPDG